MSVARQKPFQNEEELYVGLSGQKAATTDERLINSRGGRGNARERAPRGSERRERKRVVRARAPADEFEIRGALRCATFALVRDADVNG